MCRSDAEIQENINRLTKALGEDGIVISAWDEDRHCLVVRESTDFGVNVGDNLFQQGQLDIAANSKEH